MFDDLISIIIPMYNARDYIFECMRCVREQTYSNIEIIFVDDGSIDGSSELCKTYLKKDARIRYYYKNNGGAASARNLGIRQAHGRYLYFMDVDDILEKDAIELMHHACKIHNVDLVIGNVKHLNLRGGGY